MTSRLLLPVLLAVAAQVPPDSATCPVCPMRPTLASIPLPAQGFVSAMEYDSLAPCDSMPRGVWTTVPSDSLEILVYADGPNGSGYYYSVTVSVAQRHSNQPPRGFCVYSMVAGWRNLLWYSRSPLPWVFDLDEDGVPEFLYWDNFPMTEDPTMVEYGMITWVYNLDGDVFRIDLDLTHKMALELAAAYQEPVAGSEWFDDLRWMASYALRAFASGRCKIADVQNCDPDSLMAPPPRMPPPPWKQVPDEQSGKGKGM